VIQPKLLRRARNTSLILPAVIKKIAELKDISSDEMEQATTENAIRLFKLPIRKNGEGFEINELLEKLNALSELDIKIKTGLIDKQRGLELFLLNMES
jgi:DNA polymerase-3 subunit delta